MNILFAKFLNSYTDRDILFFLRNAGHKCDELFYESTGDMYHNDGLYDAIEKKIKTNSYDFVYSTNYHPVISKACYKNNIKYIAWVYDSPPNLQKLDTLDYPTNYIFWFCKYDYLNYKNMGFETVYHLPLAVNYDRLKAIRPDVKRYGSEVSFVGKIYNSTLPTLKANLPKELQNYLDAVVAVQMEKNGSQVVEAAITDDFLKQVNEHYATLSEKPLTVNRRQMYFSICEHLTHIDRMALLRLSSKTHETTLYTQDLSEIDKKLLKESNVIVKGPVNYIDEMPQVFKASKINLNPTLRANRGGVSLRCLDIIGCGGFLLSNYQEELDEYFGNCGIVMFENLEDALNKIDYYLHHDEERNTISSSCLEVVRQEFNYPKQLNTIFTLSGII